MTKWASIRASKSSSQLKSVVVNSDVLPQAPTIALNGKRFSYEAAKGGDRPLGPSSEQTKVKYKPGKIDIWLLGITIVIGGQYFSWNAGLAAGLYSYMIALFLIGSAYITLCCCTSEITGALPFAGGAYGLSRCTLGFYPAFMIGCCEALEYIAYVSDSVLVIGQMIAFADPRLNSMQPLIWALFYSSALFIHIKGDRLFWRTNALLGSVSIGILLLYCFGCTPYVNFKANANDPKTRFVGGFPAFMKVLPLAAWFFVGVESLNLASDQVLQPKVVITFAQILCVLTLAVTGIMVFFFTVSVPPGPLETATELLPFNSTFVMLFKISTETATVLSLPATYATAFGFIWCYGKLISAMATSKLLPPSLSKVTGKSGAPYAALIGGSCLSYAMCIVVYCFPTINNYLFTICITCAFMSYSGQCIGYISLKFNYRNIKSSNFHSPCGIPGAVYSLSVWILCIVSVAGYQGNGGAEIFSFLTIVALLSLYYFTYAKKRQTFSAQENRILLVAHVMKFNGKRTAAANHHNRHSPKRGTTTNASHATATETGPSQVTAKVTRTRPNTARSTIH